LPEGYLFLGKSETTGNASDLFEPLDKKIRLYSKSKSNSPQLEFTVLHPIKEKGRYDKPVPPPREDIEKSIANLMLSRYVYPSVVVNKNLMITQFFGATSQFLEPVSGKASFNILKMIREDLVIELGSLLHHVRKTEKAAGKEGIRINVNNVPHDIAIEVEPKRLSGETLFLVVFKSSPVVQVNTGRTNGGPKDSGSNDAKDKTISKLEEELVQSRGLIRTTNEEYETTYEELQANNEEILSSNEELQSVNEELETSKEELQSAVEELTTTNEELRKRNIELDQSQKELSHVNEQLKQFAFISSHDLQEPLRKILTFSNLLSNPEANLNAFGKKYTDKISASAFRMSSLLRDLLSFSMLMNNNSAFSQVNLNDVVNNVLADLGDVISEKKAVVNLSRLPVIYAEPVQMTQLFSNLITNALKFNDGNPVIDITSRDAAADEVMNYPELKRDVNYSCIRIKDNGIGFDEKFKEKIFDLFQRLNDKKNVDGTGLGLAICKKIVKNHEGLIEGQSLKGQGATFTIFLPAARPA
jgi:signal transduction histidine kinase